MSQCGGRSEIAEHRYNIAQTNMRAAHATLAPRP